MRAYPKGCRYLRAYDGTIDSMRKVTRKIEVDDLRGREGRSTVWLIVQPRGRMRWYVFRCHWLESPRLVRDVPTQNPHALAMAAMLGALQ